MSLKIPHEHAGREHWNAFLEDYLSLDKHQGVELLRDMNEQQQMILNSLLGSQGRVKPPKPITMEERIEKIQRMMENQESRMNLMEKRLELIYWFVVILFSAGGLGLLVQLFS